ncbi:MAG TPA: hypothetical protein VF167_03965 [Longimicrobiaceae bacterium]
MKSKLGFFLIIEAGDLEHKALLLVESIREFAGVYRNAPIWVVQARAGRGPSATTLAKLSEHQAYFVRAELNCTWRDYGPGNKPYSAAFLEHLLEGSVDTLVLLDSDMIFVNPPVALELNGEEVIAVRPVDEAHLGSPSDELPSTYWRGIYEVCGVDSTRVWDVRSTVDRKLIRAYFNAGLVAARPAAGLFRDWRENMERLASRRNDSTIFPSHRERWFLDQSCLAATVLARTDRRQVRILDRAYNYPLHKQPVLSAAERLTSMRELTVIHYHDEFYRTRWRRTIEVPPDYAEWLDKRLPLPSGARRLQQLRRLGKAMIAAGG